MSLEVVSLGGLVKVPGAMDAAAQHALAEIGAEGHGLVVGHMQHTVDRRGHRGRNFTGTAQQAVTAQPPRRTQVGWSQETVSLDPNKAKVAVIEDGRRPGKGVSRTGQRHLERWARLKLGVKAGKDAKRAAFLIARGIKRKGIPGIHPFGRAAKTLREGRARRILQIHLTRGLSR